jgi:exodeoxyribonuclease III
MLKVMTWNCNMAFRKKVALIKSYKPDILIVPECEHPDKLTFEFDTQPTDVFWYGDNVHKGLGVFSFTDFKIKLLKYHNPEFKWILPLKIANSVDNYTIFAIWANNPNDKNFEYVGQIWKALTHYEAKIKRKKTFFIGDFNSNTIWDKPKRAGNHSTVVDILAKKKICSTYHKYFKCEQGKEQHPTFFLYRHQDKPYHLDYCFASNDMIKKLKKVTVGTFDNWKKASDHVPLIVEFDNDIKT